MQKEMSVVEALEKLSAATKTNVIAQQALAVVNEALQTLSSEKEDIMLCNKQKLLDNRRLTKRLAEVEAILEGKAAAKSPEMPQPLMLCSTTQTDLSFPFMPPTAGSTPEPGGVPEEQAKSPRTVPDTPEFRSEDSRLRGWGIEELPLAEAIQLRRLASRGGTPRTGGGTPRVGGVPTTAPLDRRSSVRSTLSISPQQQQQPHIAPAAIERREPSEPKRDPLGSLHAGALVCAGAVGALAFVGVCSLLKPHPR